MKKLLLVILASLSLNVNAYEPTAEENIYHLCVRTTDIIVDVVDMVNLGYADKVYETLPRGNEFIDIFVDEIKRMDIDSTKEHIDREHIRDISEKHCVRHYMTKMGLN